MLKRFSHVLLCALMVVGLGALLASPQAAHANEVSASDSFVSLDSSEVEPYQSFGITLSLRDSNGLAMAQNPSGKLYIWATDENGDVASDLDLIALSLPSGVYAHETSREGVLIMDAAALITDKTFNIVLHTKGTYELHALFSEDGNVDLSAITNYCPFELRTASIDVSATPARDVATMVVSTKIRGISVDSFLIDNPRGGTASSAISIDESVTTNTEVNVALLRSNGMNVGEGVSLYIDSVGLNTSNILVRTDKNGVATFNVKGIVTDSAAVKLRVSTSDAAVTIPVQAYTYRPQQVRFDIGSNKMNVDGRTIEMDTVSVIKSGRTYVPFRAIGELLGARVEYDNNVRTITTYFDDSVLTMSVGYNHYAIDGKVYQMDAAPYINSDGRTMVPIRFIAQVIGYDVQAVTGSNNLTKSVIFIRK